MLTGKEFYDNYIKLKQDVKNECQRFIRNDISIDELKLKVDMLYKVEHNTLDIYQKPPKGELHYD